MPGRALAFVKPSLAGNTTCRALTLQSLDGTGKQLPVCTDPAG